MMPQPNLASLLAPGAKTRNLDLNALLAIAGHEGASGRIGDGGHAFGPFQLNNAGGVLTGKFQGETPEQINQWAWSPAGIKYAEDGIARVAGGQRGAQAIKSIATGFERPANVGAEISDALAHYGGSAASAAPVFSGAPAGPSPAAQPESNPLLGQLLSQTNQMVGLGSSPSLASLLSGSPIAKASAAAVPTRAPAAVSGSVKFLGDTQGEKPQFLGSLAEAVKAVGGSQVRINSGYRSPQHNAAVGGVQGSNHTTGDALDGEVLINGRWVPLGAALLPVAQKYGLRSGAVPGFFNGRPDPVHVDDGRNQR